MQHSHFFHSEQSSDITQHYPDYHQQRQSIKRVSHSPIPTINIDYQSSWYHNLPSRVATYQRQSIARDVASASTTFHQKVPTSKNNVGMLHTPRSSVRWQKQSKQGGELLGSVQEVEAE